MSTPFISDQISLFLNQIINNRRFDDESLRILESVLVSKDVTSLIEVRSSLVEVLRSVSIAVLRDIGGESVYQKLSILEFFVRSFALIGDIESCLAMRYEAFTLREFTSSTYEWLKVSHTEWIGFAEQSSENGFYSIARKACENALLSLKRDKTADQTSEEVFNYLEAAEQIKRLKHCAMTSESSNSVQAQAAKYLRTKEVMAGNTRPLLIKRSDCTASTLFRDGQKIRNQRLLQEHRSIRITLKSTSI